MSHHRARASRRPKIKGGVCLETSRHTGNAQQWLMGVLIFAKGENFDDASKALWQVSEAVKKTNKMGQVVVDGFDKNNRHHHRRDNCG